MDILGTVITGVVGDDIHVVGIRLIEHALRSANLRVISLGIQTTQAEFIAAAIESSADAFFISSSNGHAQLELAGLRDKCVEAGLDDLLIYVGGNLAVGKSDWNEVRAVFSAMGITRCYPPRSRPSDAIQDLIADLKARSSLHTATHNGD